VCCGKFRLLAQGFVDQPFGVIEMPQDQVRLRR
jgi:hypothetical protein